METTADVLSPRTSFHAFQHDEQRLREEYLRLPSEKVNGMVDGIHTQWIVRCSTILLEVFWLSACIYEAATRRGVPLATLTPAQLEALVAEARTMSRLDPASVVRDTIEHLQPRLPDNAPIDIPFSAVLRTIRSILVACPIDTLESVAAYRGMEPWGHRCRVAFDGIQAFLLRCDPSESERVAIIGRQYVRGELSLEEVASLLDMSPVDAVEALECRDFVRSLDTIILDDDARAARLSALREDRLARGGQPAAFNQERMARNVIASERIEGVDARRWITRDIN